MTVLHVPYLSEAYVLALGHFDAGEDDAGATGSAWNNLNYLREWNLIFSRIFLNCLETVTATLRGVWNGLKETLAGSVHLVYNHSSCHLPDIVRKHLKWVLPESQGHNLAMTV